MKEIKFRIYSKHDNKIIFPEELNFRNEFKEWNEVYRTEGFGVSTYDSLNDILMQFTGLKDKNGEEIYEGDILKTSCQQIKYIKRPNIHGLGAKTKTIKTEGIVTCKWIGYGFKFIHNNETKHTSDINTFEIIGNIHENKDLL